MATSQPAWADWSTKLEDDLFADGQKATMIGFMNLHQSIYIECTSMDDLTFAMVEKGDWESGMDLVPLDFILKVDDNDRMTFKGEFYRHNTLFYGIRAELKDKKKLVLQQIRDARRKILVGMKIDILDKNWSSAVPVSGSTRAAKRLMKACGFE